MRDQLNSVSVRKAQHAAFRILDQMQDLPPAEQVAGAAMMFSLLCKHFNVDPREAHAQADRRIADALKDPQLRAIKQYLREDL
jgi:hypothetical protein